LLHLCSCVQSFFGFGQSAEIEIVLSDADRKRVDVKKEDGSKNKLLLYYDGEAVSGKARK
jgi:vacuolar protein sorting-associated protein 26